MAKKVARKDGTTRRIPKPRNWKIIYQLIVLYAIAILIPILLLGIYLAVNMKDIQEKNNSDKLYYNNTGVKRTVYDVTSWINTISESVVYNEELIAFLKTDVSEYEDKRAWEMAADAITLVDTKLSKYTGLEKIAVFTETPGNEDYKNFKGLTEEVTGAEWYMKARKQYSSFWISFLDTDVYGNETYRLTLIRKMVLPGSDKEAVVMIQVKNSYLDSRTENSGFINILTVNDMPAFYSNNVNYLGKTLDFDIDYDRVNYQAEGQKDINGVENNYYISVLKPVSSSGSMIYVVTLDKLSPSITHKILHSYWMALILASITPVFVLMYSARSFSKQVLSLRNEMHKVSKGDYQELPASLDASKEIDESFKDLLEMVYNLQQMEAKQYEAQMREQSIQNEQQKTEIKMLASQINPHFLYNTLEMIRMKAVTNQDKEVATAIKLLGKCMRYVLENTGTTDATIARELEHIETYLQIQRLRFGERVSYEIVVPEDVDLSAYRCVPLLFQPIVENAISYGLEGQDTGIIRIIIAKCEDTFDICISDNGSGMTKERLEQVIAKVDNYTRVRNTSSIGLYNINRRIKLNYGDDYGIRIESEPGMGTRVFIHIPAITE